MKKKLPTLSIGIPAYNEEGNIAYLLDSLLRQKAISYKLIEIIVMCDGCTDNTASIVKTYKDKYPFIKIFDRKKRTGKAPALNYMYKIHRGDFLFQPDADLVMGGDNSLEDLMKVMISNDHIDLVSPRHLPVKEKSLWAMLAYCSYNIFSDAAMKLHNGRNAYTVMGASLIRGAFTKTFTYPKGIIGDQTYLFASVIHHNPHGYKFARKAHVYFRTVGTFKEWRELGVRSTGADKMTVLDRFDHSLVDKYYTMSREIYFTSLIKYFATNPLLTMATLGMEVYIRLFPLKNSSVKNGTWEPNASSKIGIKITI